MVDFLKAAKQAEATTIEVAGVTVEVRGLTIKELTRVSRGREKEPEAVTRDLIVACCFYSHGKPLIPEDRKSELDDISPSAFQALSEAVAKVNGFSSGNSNATDGEDSFSA